MGKDLALVEAHETLLVGAEGRAALTVGPWVKVVGDERVTEPRGFRSLGEANELGRRAFFDGQRVAELERPLSPHEVRNAPA